MLSFIFLLVSSSSSLPFLLSSLLIIFVMSVSCFNMSPMYVDIYLFDETSILMTYITFVVLMASLVVTTTTSIGVSYATFFILLSCFFVFASSNLFVIYVAYELSLLPIIYIIVSFGVYPDRLSASVYLLSFTSIFALPFSFLLFSLFSSYFTISLSTISLSYSPLSSFLTLLIFLSFSVKLPVYGLHHWLPLAHVEAPTFGSIILAGVLLNLGGVGLLRFSTLVSFTFINSYMLSYFLFFIAFVTLFCMAQSDFNRLIAYSSVSHIMLIPILYSLNSILSCSVLVIVMFFHALSSPLLFSIVGSSYSIFSSRMLSFSRGLLVVSPLFSLFILLAFILTISVPPTPSFLAEVLFVVSTFSFLPSSALLLLLFVVLSLVYNLHWFTSVVFQSSSPESSLSFSLSFKELLSNSFLMVVNVPFILLFSLF